MNILRMVVLTFVLCGFAQGQTLRDSAIEIASSEIGIREFQSSAGNPRIIEYLSVLTGVHLSESTSWCSAFAAFVIQEAGGDVSTITLSARSWSNFGVPTLSPEPGDIVVMWRSSPSSWKGHVGFFIGETRDTVFVLGGNQANSVSILEFSKKRVLSYRRADSQ